MNSHAVAEAMVAVEPSQSALDDPAAGKDHGTLDDFDGPLADPLQHLPELFASIATVGEHVAQPR